MNLLLALCGFLMFFAALLIPGTQYYLAGPGGIAVGWGMAGFILEN